MLMTQDWSRAPLLTQPSRTATGATVEEDLRRQMGLSPQNPLSLYPQGGYKVPQTYQFKAGGGSVSGGMDYLIGERGPELLRLPPGLNGWIDSNSVFKNKMMMDSVLGRSLSGGIPYPPRPSTNNSWQDDHSVSYGDINFNGIQDTSSAHRRFAMLRMMRR